MRSVVLLLALTLAHGVASGQGKLSPSLYERLGRYDGIAKIADEYLRGVRTDPQFARFSGRGADSLARARQLLKEQWCALTGGPCVYVGRDMRTAHGGLGISEADWSASMKHLTAALEKCRVSGTDKDEFLALIDSLKQQFVEKDATKQ
jgi:hemoglobin